MAVPMPDLITIKRRTTSANTFVSEATISTSVACLIAPAAADGTGTTFGTYANYEYLVFVSPGVDVKFKDIIIDLSDNKEYIVTDPPVKFKNPNDWTQHHIEFKMRPVQ